MIKKRFIVAVKMLMAITLVACATASIKPIPPIPGVDTTSVWVQYDEEKQEAIITGQVSRGVDRLRVEEYVRSQYALATISNRVTVR